MSNKWYFYEEKEIVELTPCARYDGWLRVVGKSGYSLVDSWEESRRLFDTKKECIEHALNIVKTKKVKYENLEADLNRQLVFETLRKYNGDLNEQNN